jgi:hypothetical protein
MLRAHLVAASLALGLGLAAWGSSPSTAPEASPGASPTMMGFGGGASVLAIAGLFLMNRRKDGDEPPASHA